VTAEKPLLICLMGPTASGKTDLAIKLAEKFDCELVSVDSALVYRGLDIGSAKPEYPHHLVDIRDAAEIYSAADFVTDASRLVDEITSRGKTPLLVGGTMLYFKAFLEGLADMPAADADIRKEIEVEAAAHGWPYIHSLLKAVDPVAAERIHPNHSQRLSRALEVYRASGIPLTEWHDRGANTSFLADLKNRYRIVQLAVCPVDRSELHARIQLRFEQMLEQGLLDEVKRLKDREELHLGLPSMRAVGYRQLWQHLEGTISLEEAQEKAVAATRQLAKRQLTWLRKWPEVEWIMTDRDGNVAESARFPALVGSSPMELALNYLTFGAS
jgi:tRNA dimethylallyltransferase